MKIIKRPVETTLFPSHDANSRRCQFMQSSLCAPHGRLGHGARLMGSFGIGVLLLIVSLPTRAVVDEKRYPGSMCRVWEGPGAFLNFSSLVANGLPGKAEPSHVPGGCPPPQAGGCPPCDSVPACKNDPKYIVRVDCPIPKSFPDGGISNVTVDVIDRHAVHNVECFLTSALWNPASNSFSQNNAKLVSAGQSNAIQPLVFAPLLPVGPASHWYVACSLPPNSAVVSYYVKEK